MGCLWYGCLVLQLKDSTYGDLHRARPNKSHLGLSGNNKTIQTSELTLVELQELHATDKGSLRLTPYHLYWITFCQLN